MPEKDLYLQSEYINLVSSMMKRDLKSEIIINRFHTIRKGDGNTLFYVITKDSHHYLVNIMGRKIENDALLYWIESINSCGKIVDFFYDRDLFALVFFRGKKYNNEYLVYLYSFGHAYPAVRLIPENIYPNYRKMLAKNHKSFLLDLPDDLMIKSAKT